MTRPDTLADTRLHFLAPRAAPPEGFATVRVDLAAFFALVERIGRDEALLLLLVRALRQRGGLFALRVHDLAWMLRVPNRRIIRWLDRLTDAQLAVYHAENIFGVESVAVEIASIDRLKPEFAASVERDLPSHWFVQVLPLIGRTSFTVYLFFHWSEAGNAEVHIDRVVRSVRLRSRAHAHSHVRRLKRAGLLMGDGAGSLVVRDPPPPTALERFRLRIRAIPHLRAHLAQIGVAIAIGIAVVAFLVLSATTFPPQPERPLYPRNPPRS